jgi:uncharacterized alpha-E superfamily protein
MLSRVADSIYWMARYMERAENLARLLLSTQDLLLDAGAEAADESQFWGPLLMTTGDEEVYFAAHPEAEGATVADFLALSPKNPNCILNCVRTARENARTIRDQISDEMWECINSLRLFLESPEAAAMHRYQSAAFYEKVLIASYQFQGIASSTTPRDEIWYFLRLGMCIERADKTSRLIDTCSAISLDMPPSPLARPLRWAALLRSCSAWHAFQAYSSNKLDPVKIIEYLLLDETFPRSVAWCVEALHNTLTALCGSGRLDDMKSPIRACGRLRADIAYITMPDVLKEGLHEYIDRLQEKLNDIGQTIYETFVRYSDAAPADSEIASPTPVLAHGAFHTFAGADLQMQQQQQ